MKKITSFLVVLFLGLQIFAQMGPLPIDPQMKKGVLDNGMTYYIRANQEPRGQAEFFIVQKVGSIEEEESQRGLAHFLEHMAFNGLKHFPDKDLFKFTEGIGVKFGYNLNAYTSFDRTVYNISAVPVSREGIIDSCLLVLYDWADGLNLEQKAIDEERGVIREEMRTRDNGFMRIYEKLGLQLMPNNIYSVRWPIGIESVIMHFERQEIKDYYEKWYRPDHQAIVIIGDFDADKVEAKVKALFSTIEKPAEPQELVFQPVADNEEALVGVETDPEMTQTGVSIDFKSEVIPAEVTLSAQGLIINYVNSLIGDMFWARFDEIRQKPNAPFLAAYAGYGGFFLTNHTEAFSVSATCKEGGVKEGYVAMMTEIARVKQHGFTAGEFTRAKANYLSRLEKRFNEKNTIKSEDYAQECVRNFLDDEAMPGIETEYALINQVADYITIDAVNQMLQQYIKEDNVVIYAYGPKKDGLVYPTKEELAEEFENIMAEDVEAYVDNVSDEPLISEVPAKGSIVAKAQNTKFGATVYTLSNGIKVVAKKTDFKDDEILFTASSFGGSSLLPDADVANIQALNQVIGIGGVGNFSKIDLEKQLAGKIASARASVAETSEDINGSCSPKYIETMFQLIYLNATAQRYDADAFESWKQRTATQISQMKLNPMIDFIDSVYSVWYNNNPRKKALMSMETLNNVDYQRCIDLFKNRFADMSDFTFTFVGNIDEREFEPLIEQYIATLPSINRKESWKDLGIEQAKGKINCFFSKEVENPKTSVGIIYNGVDVYSPANELKYKITGEILDMVYTREVREKEGGTYGVQVQCALDRIPKPEYTLLYIFDTDPEKVARLTPIFEREMKQIAKKGPEKEHWDKTIEYLKKENTQNQRENRAWLNAIDEYFTFGTDAFTNAEQLLASITAKDIKKIVAKILKDNNRIDVQMTGVKKAE